MRNRRSSLYSISSTLSRWPPAPGDECGVCVVPIKNPRVESRFAVRAENANEDVIRGSTIDLRGFSPPFRTHVTAARTVLRQWVAAAQQCLRAGLGTIFQPRRKTLPVAKPGPRALAVVALRLARLLALATGTRATLG